MKIKLKRNISTGLAVRTTLKAGDISYDGREDQNDCFSKCNLEYLSRINKYGWSIYANLAQRERCLNTC